MSRLPDPAALQAEFEQQLASAQNAEDVERLRIQWLGRKDGRLTALMRQLGDMPMDLKRLWGPRLNSFKADLEKSLGDKQKNLLNLNRTQAFEADAFDISLPGTPVDVGRTHPLYQVMETLTGIFQRLGFVCANGPEMESEFYNFDALNVPPNHPARDMQDTFYLGSVSEAGAQPLLFADQPVSSSEPILLRTHTSPVQIHVLQNYPPPVAIIAPGRVYRNEAQDATHLATFHQMEGLLVDQNLSFADLKGTLSRFAQLFFAPTVRTRFKPSFFPFTEPSAQMDVSCWQCEGTRLPAGRQNCKTCKGAGWIELLGAGMVNPKVLEAVHLDPVKYSGFAFGMGIERLAMLKFGVEDLRLFYENDVRFLQQF